MAVIGVCWKALELRRRVEPITGEVLSDPASLGVSAADEAALELALRSRTNDDVVRVCSVGGARGDAVLRRALAAGADEAVRVELDDDAPSSLVAEALAEHLEDARLVWCGDVSTDRSSGSVPAFLSAALGLPQALGLAGVELDASGGGLAAVRHLDGGRREVLRVVGRAVLSVGGGAARLRRARLGAVLRADGLFVAVHHPRGGGSDGVRTAARFPARPPTHTVAPPGGSSARERTASLLSPSRHVRARRVVRLEAAEAARMILSTLADWGEL